MEKPDLSGRSSDQLTHVHLEIKLAVKGEAAMMVMLQSSILTQCTLNHYTLSKWWTKELQSMSWPLLCVCVCVSVSVSVCVCGVWCVCVSFALALCFVGMVLLLSSACCLASCWTEQYVIMWCHTLLQLPTLCLQLLSILETVVSFTEFNYCVRFIA